MMPSRLVARVLAAALCAASCASPAPATRSAVECRPLADTGALALHAEDLAGDYRLTLVATRGPHAGQSVTGNLWLVPFDSVSRYPVPAPGLPGSDAAYPLHGRADLPLDSLGAGAPGATSDNAQRPGVLVIAWRSPAPSSASGITIRFGAEANRPRVTPFDGAFTALHVGGAIDRGFAGSWITGGAQPEGGGYFCAARSSPRG